MTKLFGPHQFVPDNAERFLSHLRNWPAWFLEVGTLEGRSACWLLDNFPLCHLVTVDPSVYYPIGWDKEKDGKIQDRVRHNLSEYGNRVEFINDYSHNILPRLCLESFDFIYIDGDHCYEAVFRDAWDAWPLLKPGGIMIFDDYEWNYRRGGGNMGCPHDAIDKFISQITLDVLALNFQAVVRKRC